MGNLADRCGRRQSAMVVCALDDLSRSSVIGRRKSDFGNRTSVIGRRKSAIGIRTSVIGYRNSAIGFRPLALYRLAFGARNLGYLSSQSWVFFICVHSPTRLKCGYPLTGTRSKARYGSDLNQSHNGSHGHRFSAIGIRTSVIGYRLSDVGHRFSAT
jgi:hypothetical protein